MAQLTLIPGLESASSAQSADKPKLRGRGATPKCVKDVVLDAPNPAGRTKLCFEYRPLKGWELERENQALALIVFYFSKLAGFRRADDAIVRTFYQALADFTADEIRWAIEAKAASLRADDRETYRLKRIFLGRPETFIARMPYWLEVSPQYQKRLEAQRSAAKAQRLDALQHARAEADERARASTDGALEDRLARQAAERRRLLTEQRVRRAEFWDRLTDPQRRAAIAAAQPRFKERCAQWGENPEDPRLDDVLRDMAITWATAKWPAVGGT